MPNNPARQTWQTPSAPQWTLSRPQNQVTRMPMGMADAATALFADHLNDAGAPTGRTVTGLCCRRDMDRC